MHARAIDFIFKPHGDAGDSDSIILTREQYRQLLPQGERQSALESLKMLLASRPIVYLDFGLRDPDFIYVRDLLANTYKGGTRDHYAIMADVDEGETDYWRRNYGIHLLSYPAPTGAGGKRDHTALLKLLDQLNEPPELQASFTSIKVDEPLGSDIVLALARHAARLSRAPRIVPELPIRVQMVQNARGGRNELRRDAFDQFLVDRFLDDGPARAILVGLPGAGKTYALRQAAARAAARLHDKCLAEPFDNSPIVPILIDLKLYRGDLEALIDQTLPPNLPCGLICRTFNTQLYLDSFNEMPREYWESGTYEGDFAAFCEKFADVSMVIGSRTDDGLTKLQFPVYSLDSIDANTVSMELDRLGIHIEGRFGNELRLLLQKPFYFQLIASGLATLRKDARPRDLYSSFFSNLSASFVSRFGRSLDLEMALSTTAYDAVNRGEEAYPLSDLLRVLQLNLESVDGSDLSAKDVANWLVSSSVLIPYIGNRVAFVHQSITEYLAATELARRYTATPKILRAKLALRRWDQSLFLALSLLSPERAETFFRDVAEADFDLALDAVKYLEDGRDQVVSKLLILIPDRVKNADRYPSNIDWLLRRSVPVTSAHETELRLLVGLGDTVGGAAAAKLIEIFGPVVKEEFLNHFLTHRMDYNYCCNGIGPALKEFATPADVRLVASMADTLAGELNRSSPEEMAHGFTSGTAEFLSGLDVSVIREGLLPDDDNASVPEARARILCHLLWSHKTTQGLQLAADLLLRGVDQASTAIYFIASGARGSNLKVSWASFTLDHVNILIDQLDEFNRTQWPLQALREVCSERPDLAVTVAERACRRAGLVKALLLHCAAPNNQTPIFAALGEFVSMTHSAREHAYIQLLDQIEINWTGQEALLVALLKLRDPTIAIAVVESSGVLLEPRTGLLDIGPIEWWLEWVSEFIDDNFILAERLSSLFLSRLPNAVRNLFLEDFNRATSKHRRVLLRWILIRMEKLTTDDFSSDAVSFLLADLNHAPIHWWRGHLIGQTATEQFVTERLLPLLPEADSILSDNLKNVLSQAGSRHGRRYLKL